MDYEYDREGVVNLFLCCELLAGQRWADVTAQRTRRDWAQQIQQLVDVRYPNAESLVLVMDHLNVHRPGALYDVFAPAEAERLADKLEIHHTPKHGSRLNMAEIAISIVARNCLSQPVPDLATLYRRVGALEAERNAQRCTIRWQFTTGDARSKLHDLYPPIQTNMD